MGDAGERPDRRVSDVLRFGKVAGHRVAAVAYRRKKSENDFPRSVIDLAQRKADAFMTELGADGFVDADD